MTRFVVSVSSGPSGLVSDLSLILLFGLDEHSFGGLLKLVGAGSGVTGRSLSLNMMRSKGWWISDLHFVLNLVVLSPLFGCCVGQTGE